jgi:hypothetical protein
MPDLEQSGIDPDALIGVHLKWATKSYHKMNNKLFSDG